MAHSQSVPQLNTNQLDASAPSPSYSTSLYVGDLEEIVSEGQLYDLFSTIAPVVSVRLCRDLVTKRSLGYAYVNYNTFEEASSALESLNFALLRGKPLRIMFSHRDPSLRKSGAANIFVKNLGKSMDSKALKDKFNVFGNILSCKVAVDSLGQSKGYGFVQFDNEESAQKAIDEINGTILNNKQVFVGPFVRCQERENTEMTPKFNNVYVKNLTETTTDADLHKAFGPFGPITSAVVMRDTDGTSKCFGFVNFEHVEDAAKAVEALNGKVVGDKEWFVGRAQKKHEREAELKAKFRREGKENNKNKNTNLYLKNLDDIIDDAKLKELFEEFGTITSCKVMRDHQGQSMGSGFVAFSSPDAASQVIAEMNGMMVGNKPLYVAPAQRKEERQALLRAQFSKIQSSTSGDSVPQYTVPPNNFEPSQEASYNQASCEMAIPQQVLAGCHTRSSGQVPHLNQHVQRMGGRHGDAISQWQRPQQFLHRRGDHIFTYSSDVRNAPDSTLSQENSGSIQPDSVRPTNVSYHGQSINTLASALVSASTEKQRIMLGDKLYSLVDKLEHDRAGKITGMLLEMDLTEVFHLLQSPVALKAKVAEAMKVLGSAQSSFTRVPTDQFSSLTLNKSPS